MSPTGCASGAFPAATSLTFTIQAVLDHKSQSACLYMGTLRPGPSLMEATLPAQLGMSDNPPIHNGLIVFDIQTNATTNRLKMDADKLVTVQYGGTM